MEDQCLPGRLEESSGSVPGTGSWRAYDLNPRSRSEELDPRCSSALRWRPGDPAILDTLARKVEPGRVLIHFPDWRTDEYDENYPTYTASKAGREFVAKSRDMGFRIMPHFNSIDMDPSNPVYARIRDFQYREIERKALQGWSWYNGRPIGVPESNGERSNHRDKKVMVKIHPGLAIWRSILGSNVETAVRDLSLETVFLDVTLNSYNLHNCLVDAITPTEGMKRLIDEIADLGEGTCSGRRRIKRNHGPGIVIRPSAPIP